MAWANGTRTKRCRAGRSASSGAGTASRCGPDPALLADLGDDAAEPAAGIDAQFAAALCRLLAVSANHVQPAFEDTYYYLWKEGTLPSDLDPRNPKLNDPLERERLRRLFTAH